MKHQPDWMILTHLLMTTVAMVASILSPWPWLGIVVFGYGSWSYFMGFQCGRFSGATIEREEPCSSDPRQDTFER